MKFSSLSLRATFLLLFFSCLHSKKIIWMEYMATDNDLNRWAAFDLQEMAKIGSNEHIVVVAQIDCLGANGNSKRLLIQKNKILEISHGPKLDFGSVDTVVDFVTWAVEHYSDDEADEYVLVFWNHGSGYFDPRYGNKLKPIDDLFHFNYKTQLFELDRSISYLDLGLDESRGVCFSETTKTYLTNAKLTEALQRITKILGKKLSIVGFDACLMQMVEVVAQVEPFTDYVVASAEVEFASGWEYSYILEPFMQKPLSIESLAQHIVTSYERCYKTKSADYTLSALHIHSFKRVRESLDKLSKELLHILATDTTNQIKKTILASRHKKVCTCYAEPTYIDLKHFLNNLKAGVALMTIQKNSIQSVNEAIDECLIAIDATVIANVKGPNIPYAGGVSIYFPERRIDPDYNKTIFGSSNAWHQFIQFVAS